VQGAPPIQGRIGSEQKVSDLVSVS
jgi:hypothetical protein